MLNLDFDETRKQKKGQYLIKLISWNYAHEEPENSDHLSYWCDFPHLKQQIKGMISTLKQEHRRELLDHLFERYGTAEQTIEVKFDGE